MRLIYIYHFISDLLYKAGPELKRCPWDQGLKNWNRDPTGSSLAESQFPLKLLEG